MGKDLRTEAEYRPTLAAQRDLFVLSFWMAAYFGTVAAGGVFGVLVCLADGGGPPFMGLAFGILFAGPVAIPIHATVAIMTWMLWMSRFRVISAGLAGGLTGVLATQVLSNPFASPYVLGAGLIGATGGAAAGAWANKVLRNRAKDVSGNRVWQFTLRDLFLRMTVFAMLLGAWTWAVRAVSPARVEQEQRFQEYDVPSDYEYGPPEGDATAGPIRIVRYRRS